MKIGQGAGIACGVLLMFAPAVFGYVDTTAEDVHRIVGPLVLTWSTIAVWNATRDLRWLNVPGALALVTAPLAGDHPTTATIVALITGVVLAGSAPFGGADNEQRDVGWRGLLQAGSRGE